MLIFGLTARLTYIWHIWQVISSTVAPLTKKVTNEAKTVKCKGATHRLAAYLEHRKH